MGLGHAQGEVEFGLEALQYLPALALKGVDLTKQTGEICLITQGWFTPYCAPMKDG
jgi:hypothetical protein